MTSKLAKISFGIMVACLSAASTRAADATATRTIPRGSIVSSDDLTGDTRGLVGLEATRTLRAGTTINAAFLREPRLVKRNQTVTLVFKAGRLEMETVGRSLDEGGEGELISVMNLNSRQRVTGRVIGEGRVEVSR